MFFWKKRLILNSLLGLSSVGCLALPIAALSGCWIDNVKYGDGKLPPPGPSFDKELKKLANFASFDKNGDGEEIGFRSITKMNYIEFARKFIPFFDSLDKKEQTKTQAIRYWIPQLPPIPLLIQKKVPFCAIDDTPQDHKHQIMNYTNTEKYQMYIRLIDVGCDHIDGETQDFTSTYTFQFVKWFGIEKACLSFKNSKDEKGVFPNWIDSDIYYLLCDNSPDHDRQIEVKHFFPTVFAKNFWAKKVIQTKH